MPRNNPVLALAVVAAFALVALIAFEQRRASLIEQELGREIRRRGNAEDALRKREVALDGALSRLQELTTRAD